MSGEHIFDRRKRRAAALLNRLVGTLYGAAQRLGWGRQEQVDLAAFRPARILVIQLDRIGDAIMATPVYTALKQAYPEAHMAALVRPLSESLLRHNPHIDELILHAPPWWSGGGWLRELWAYIVYPLTYLRWVRQLRSHKFDLAIELRGDFRHILLYAFWGGCRYRISYDRTGGRDLLTRALPFDPALHVVEGNLRLLEPLGIREKEPQLQLWVSEQEKNAVADKLAALGVQAGQPYVVVHPGARIETKRWPAERFASVIEWLAQRGDVAIVLVGGADEVALCEEIAAQVASARPAVLAGQLSLLELAELLRRSRLFLGSDSGPQHIAAAVRAPTIVLFGPTDPEIYGPWSEQATVLQMRQACWPCFHARCPPASEAWSTCMNAITVESVCEAIERMGFLGAATVGVVP